MEVQMNKKDIPPCSFCGQPHNNFFCNKIEITKEPVSHTQEPWVMFLCDECYKKVLGPGVRYRRETKIEWSPQ